MGALVLISPGLSTSAKPQPGMREPTAMRGASRGQPPVSGQGPDFSVNCPWSAPENTPGPKDIPLIQNDREHTFCPPHSPAFARQVRSYRMFYSCLTHHPSQVWGLKTKCLLWGWSPQLLTHSLNKHEPPPAPGLGPGGAQGWKVQRGARRNAWPGSWRWISGRATRLLGKGVLAAEQARSTGGGEGPAHAWEETLASPTSPR